MRLFFRVSDSYMHNFKTEYRAEFGCKNSKTFFRLVRPFSSDTVTDTTLFQKAGMVAPASSKQFLKMLQQKQKNLAFKNHNKMDLAHKLEKGSIIFPNSELLRKPIFFGISVSYFFTACLFQGDYLFYGTRFFQAAYHYDDEPLRQML